MEPFCIPELSVSWRFASQQLVKPCLFMWKHGASPLKRPPRCLGICNAVVAQSLCDDSQPLQHFVIQNKGFVELHPRQFIWRLVFMPHVPPTKLSPQLEQAKTFSRTRDSENFQKEKQRFCRNAYIH